MQGATWEMLEERITSLRASVGEEDRVIIALAGTPGSGKSSVAAGLMNLLRGIGVQDVALVPMDGFHYTKAALRHLPDPDGAMRCRGAPFTFDSEAFVALVRRLKKLKVTREEDLSLSFLLPSFLHATQDPVENDIFVSSTAKIVILEGNYTLLNQHPWDEVAALAHERWLVHVPRDIAKDRIVQRHLSAGIERTREAAEIRAEKSDMINGDLIMANLCPVDVVIKNDAQRPQPGR